MLARQLLKEERQLYYDRAEAGHRLVRSLGQYAGTDTVVFAVPRGGLPVAAEMARGLDLMLDVIVVHKLTSPDLQTAYGAVSDEGSMVFNKMLAKRLGLNEKDVLRQADSLKDEVERRTAFYRSQRPFPRIVSKTVIVVDDGLSSGYTMSAAIKALRMRRAGRVVAATPLASESACELVKSMADETICPAVVKSTWFDIPSFYRKWSRLSDRDALQALTSWRRRYGQLVAAGRVHRPDF